MAFNLGCNFNTLLYPTDLEPESFGGLRYGLAIAAAYGGKLLVCHCKKAARERDGADDLAHKLEQILTNQLGPSKSRQVKPESFLIEGDSGAAITRAAAELHADLVIVSSRRRNREAALMGSTVESICRTAPCPVLLVNPDDANASNERLGDRVMMRRVLVGYDYSSDSELALSCGISLAERFQAELDLIHILLPRAKPEAPEIAGLPSSAEIAFGDASARLRTVLPARVLDASSVKLIAREGKPYREILAYADENDVHLICMGAGGTGFGMQSLFGSNVDRVVRQAPCPVLIARPRRPAILKKPDTEAPVSSGR